MKPTPWTNRRQALVCVHSGYVTSATLRKPPDTQKVRAYFSWCSQRRCAFLASSSTRLPGKRVLDIAGNRPPLTSMLGGMPMTSA